MIPDPIATLGSAVCFAQASMTFKRFPESHPIAVNAIGMTVGALFLAGLTVIAGNEVVMTQQTDTWWAVVYMVVVGSVVVFSLSRRRAGTHRREHRRAASVHPAHYMTAPAEGLRRVASRPQGKRTGSRSAHLS